MDTTISKQLIFIGYLFYSSSEKNCTLQTGISIYHRKQRNTELLVMPCSLRAFSTLLNEWI